MEFIKFVNVNITPIGKLEILDVEGEGNYKVYRTEITEEDFSTISDWEKLIVKILPENFKCTVKDNCVFISCDDNIKFSFSIDITRKGVYGLIGKYGEIFFYKWGSSMNTGRFFSKIYGYFENYFKDTISNTIIFNKFCELLPQAIKHFIGKNYSEDKLYIADLGTSENTRLFAFDFHVDKFVLLGRTYYSDYRDTFTVYGLEYYRTERISIDNKIKALIDLEDFVTNVQL